jgi:bacterioferritin-associated ferredoxin
MKISDLSDLKVANPDKIICFCMKVTQKEIESSIKLGAKTLSDVHQMTGACTGNQCKELNPSGKCCSGEIIQLIKKLDFNILNHIRMCKEF